MREIKFRGFREKTSEWVYGYLVIREEPFLHDIVSPIGNHSSCTWSIKRGSEGQYTGRKDKDGVEVYDGDVITAYFDAINGQYLKTYTVKFDEFHSLYPFEDFDRYEGPMHFTVIGNRYENPELSKEV